MNNKIIVALDSNNIKKIKKLVHLLKNEVYGFKIGYEFFLNFGIDGYNQIKKISSKIFLDLKLHDIPNTVKNAIKAIEKLGPEFTTIHLSGGDEMQKLSITKKKRRTKILGVSILTSLDPIQTKKYYKESNIKKLVRKFIKNAKLNGLDGIVCSPLEIELVKKEVGNSLLIVVPGIRLNNSKIKKDDQKRFVSPKKAIDLGADLLVIGRPITSAKNPLIAIKEINESIN